MSFSKQKKQWEAAFYRESSHTGSQLVYFYANRKSKYTALIGPNSMVLINPDLAFQLATMEPHLLDGKGVNKDIVPGSKWTGQFKG